MKGNESARGRDPTRIAIKPGAPDFDRQIGEPEKQIDMSRGDANLRVLPAEQWSRFSGFRQPECFS